MKWTMKKMIAAAAIIAVLSTTVYAAGELRIKTLWSVSNSKIYKTVQQAEEKAGFEMDDLNQFTNGYGFAGARLLETKALDENDKVKLTYKEIEVELKNAAGDSLRFMAHEYQEGIVDSKVVPSQTLKIDDVLMKFRLHHYKLVPEDYVQTEADKLWLQQPGNFISYGYEKGITESEVAFLNWEKDGICYILMDMDASESADTLVSMASELIRNGK